MSDKTSSNVIILDARSSPVGKSLYSIDSQKKYIVVGDSALQNMKFNDNGNEVMLRLKKLLTYKIF